MSRAYPNYQNMSYYDYVHFVKRNELFFQKLREVKPVVDDGCPESVHYMKQSGKLHKFFTQLEREKELHKQNKNLFKKLSHTLSRRSTSNYLSNPYPTKLHVESKNFMDDFSKKNKGKKNYEQNMLLDKKMKSLKSDYQAEELEKDFERILSYKKILSHKNSLFFDSSSPSISRTGVDFFSTKKSSKVNILPKLSKVDLLDPKIKTTSTNFFRNRNTNDLDFKNNLLLISRNSNNNIKVSESNNINVNKEINENNIGTASFEQTKKESAKDANSIVNMQSHSPKNLKDEILEEIPNIEMNDNKDYNIDNLMIVGMQNDLEQIKRQTKSNFDINIRLESKQSVKSDLELNEKENSKIIKSNSNNVIHTDNKMINDVIENEMLGNENDLDNEQIKVDGKLNENIVKKTENENFPETEDKNNTVSKEEFKLLNIKQKNSAKTYKDMNKDNSLMIKEFSFDQRNRTYLISAKNRIVIDSDKSINEKITNSTAKQLEDKMMKPNENLDKDKDALEKMRKLEEMELNDDLSQSEKSQNKINSSMNHKSKIVENLEHKDNLENDNEIIMTDTKPIENDKTHDSKQLLNIETKTMNANLSENILNDEVKNDIKQNSFNRLEAGDFNNNVLKSNVLNEVDKEINENTKNSDEKINEPQIKEEAEKEEIKNNSKENVSNYFVATNQNFYSSAVNFNPINSNFYSNNNMCAFDKTNSSNNIFSLTTVNNFMSKELNNKQINYNFQIDEKEVYNNNNNNNNSPISNLNKELEDLDNEINNKIPNNNSKNKQFTSEKKYPPSYLNNKTKKVFTIKKTINKSISPKKTKNPRKEHKEIFELDDEENLKYKDKTVLYNEKAFMDKLNLVDVTVYMRYKKLFVEVNPISLFSEKIFILCFDKKEDRNMISKVFKNYQSFVNNLYYDYPKIEVRTKHPMNYISNWYLKDELKKIEDERNKQLVMN